MKIFTSIWMVIVFAIVLTGIRIDNSDTVKILRYKTWDKFQTIKPRQIVSDSVTVVNITEQDLKTYGQWPWPTSPASLPCSWPWPLTIALAMAHGHGLGHGA